MIKRTIYFGNPAYLSLQNNQLVLRKPDEDGPFATPGSAVTTIPVEDIGVLVLDNKQITITQALLEALMQNNTAVLTCDSTHHPVGMLMPLSGNTLQNERYRSQLDSSEPLRKQLWAQTVTQKIKNQHDHLALRGLKTEFLVPLYKNVKSGDSDNAEGVAAAYYWKTLSPALHHHETEFRRDRHGLPPNNLFNYGYAILRAVMARSLVGAGLLPTLGIHHANRYNAFCLADDLMEPYRPYVDQLVCEILQEHPNDPEIPKEVKAKLLKIPVLDVNQDGERSPLMIGTQRTAVSLVRCYEGTQRKLSLPELL